MKFSQYNYIVNDGEEVIVINVKNSNYVRINQKEQIEHFNNLLENKTDLNEHDEMAEALYLRGFAVDDDRDEYQEVKNSLSNYFKQQEKLFEVCLYVTDQCNFRCVYCPQEHLNNYFSDENWEALYKHIENGVKTGKYDCIMISFFGGEPLLEIDKIMHFLEKLQSIKKAYPNLTFDHSITTNGYLLTPDVYRKLTGYDVNFYQITVDGFKQSHDSMRFLAGGQRTWDKITENLKFIDKQNDNATILLRTNYNLSNVDSMEDWIKWEKNNFTNKKFHYDYVPVSGFSERVPKELMSGSNSDSAKSLKKNLKRASELLKPYSGMCHSAYPSFYTIATDGRIAKCENLSEVFDDLFIGKLSETGEFILKDNYEKWTENFEIEECSTCKAYPICCARKCPANKALYPDSRPDCKKMKRYFEKRISRYIDEIK